MAAAQVHSTRGRENVLCHNTHPFPAQKTSTVHAFLQLIQRHDLSNALETGNDGKQIRTVIDSDLLEISLVCRPEQIRLGAFAQL